MNYILTGNTQVVNDGSSYTGAGNLGESLRLLPPFFEEREFRNEEVSQVETVDMFEKYLQDLAEDAPGIEHVRKSTEDLPFLSKLITEDRKNE